MILKIKDGNIKVVLMKQTNIRLFNYDARIVFERL